MERKMKITLIALGAGAGCLLLAGSAMAGPCTAQIESLTKQLAATDAGMGPTENSGVGAGTMEQSAVNPVSPSGSTQTPTTPAAASLEKAKMYDQAGDEAACMDEITKAQSTLAQ